MPGEEIDDPVEIGAVADRDLDRHHLGREVRLHVLEDPLEVGVLLVHQGHEEHPRQMPLVADFPDLFGPHLDAAGPAQHHDGRVGRVQTGDHFTEVVEVPRGIDEIDLGVEPLGVAEGEVDRVFAIDFVGRVIGERGAVFHGAVPAAAAGHPGESVHEGRLATRPVANERHIPDGVGAIDLHGLHLLT